MTINDWIIKLEEYKEKYGGTSDINAFMNYPTPNGIFSSELAVVLDGDVKFDLEDCSITFSY